MIILPAIDLHNGQCVLLQKGDFATAQQVAESPLTAVAAFEAAGAKWLHMVDLDGAKEGRRVNREVILEVARATTMKIELGGGIRDMEAASDYLANGVSRVILGSAALKNPAFVREAVERYGARIAVGIDARGGLVASEGWLEDSAVGYIEFAKQMEKTGVKVIIFTDISRDGMLAGPAFEQLEALSGACGCSIIASGGVSSIGDVIRLKAMGLYGAICGKAVYSGGLDLRQAVSEGGAQDAC
ncbi:MAG: 1-(5-phosphoribosyl)-5-[(5-phosphoribosylamino)methylideneamino]imidazole-4-carboxamide isomerase [Clostridia bacterium]|nr:1-(5-phosphoribosyl)-5-[(5-phosphoribosylamino)methylideneamino]imidazole-4-carboxamide isomerase [Clostridia bacterium]